VFFVLFVANLISDYREQMVNEEFFNLFSHSSGKTLAGYWWLVKMGRFRHPSRGYPPWTRADRAVCLMSPSIRTFGDER
jgi:hypothetical protein